ncbi:hypothetical protein GCM10020254_53930 [Streptomyces goshikiensis]
MFSTVLVANRGEIAVRVIRTLRELGVRSVAVFSDADADARHVREADTAVRIGPAAAAESYLSVERLLDAARRSGAEAIHPGYGFLAENAGFAQACAEAGLAFIGPPAKAISLMGDKIRAKETVKAAGVPVVPGSSGSGLSDAELVAAAEEIGMPVLLKPSAGGGGKGMRLVRDAGLLAEEIAAARREARSSFGDDTLLVERWVDRPRHIEIQVLADSYGNVVHLGERECSLQRRHQKVIEEAPSVLLTPELRASMGAAAVEAARSCGYVGAGTVEFIVPGGDPSSYYFMEMNTRLQVEHPVTELITGLDLVEQQLRVASGAELGFGQADVTLTGHAVEARVCAEDPARGFLPSGGTVLALSEPSGGSVRTDSGLVAGVDTGSTYDPMLSKVIAYGPDRATALRILRGAPGGHGDPGRPDQHRVPAQAPGAPGRGVGQPGHRSGGARPVDAAPGGRPAGGLRGGGPAGRPPPRPPLPFRELGRPLRGRRRLAPGRYPRLDGPPLPPPGPGAGVGPLPPLGRRDGAPARRGLRRAGPGPDRQPGRGPRHGGTRRRHAHLQPRPLPPEGTWLGRDGDSWHVQAHDPVTAALSGRGHAGAETLAAPMPGTVTVVKVAVGDKVTAGQSLLVVEAMKMEHVISAPHSGTVAELDVSPGTTVAMDQVLAVVTPEEPRGEEEEGK